jgi:Zn-dependent peptidase ImmA (M78 family)
MPMSFSDAEQLAGVARSLTNEPEGPLLDLQSACERLGLLSFSLDLGLDAGDAAYVEAEDVGVAVVNGTTEPGRRRYSLAHELGHHLVGDAYEPTPRLGTTDDSERLLNAFAAYFLMPRSAVVSIWNAFSQQSPRSAAVILAARFRVSWTVACNQLRNLDLIDSRERELLIERDLSKGEMLELGERWVSELDPPAVPPSYAQSVINAYRARKLTSSRTVELLWGLVEESDLPEVEEAPVDALRNEFTSSV